MSEEKNLQEVKEVSTVEVLSKSFESIREANKLRISKEIAETIEAHPFVEITDTSTFKDGKANRTALKTVCASIKTGDKKLASLFSQERKKQSEAMKDLLKKIEPSLDKQQLEVDKYVLKKQQEKEAEEKKEEKRVEGIKGKIKEIEEAASNKLKACTLDNFEEIEEFLENLFSIEFDFEEFEILFDELEERTNDAYEETMINLKKKAEEELKRVKQNQLSKYNECKLFALERIDEAEVKDLSLSQDIEKYFQGISFDFGDLTTQYEELKEKSIEKASKKVEELKVQALKDAELEELKKKEALRVAEQEAETKREAAIAEETKEIKEFILEIDEKINSLTKASLLSAKELLKRINEFKIIGLTSKNKNHAINGVEALRSCLAKKEAKITVELQTEKENALKQQEERVLRLKQDKSGLNTFLDELNLFVAEKYIGQNRQPETIEFYSKFNASFEKWMADTREEIKNY